jgi:UDP-galactopyranose mutase
VALPEYVSSWEVAMIPAGRAAGPDVLATALQFIAAGIPVVATPNAKLQPLALTPGLTRLAETPEGVVSAIGDALCELRAAWLAKADAFLADQSWDLTWASIDAELCVISGSTEPPRPSRLR